MEVVRESAVEDVRLRDGSLAHLRRARSEDRQALEQFVNGLSEESLAFRFFESPVDRSVMLRQLMPARNNYVLLAFTGDAVIGHAAYYRSGKAAAEIGLIVGDAFQGRGLGTVMIERIARSANLGGISVFDTIISPDNTRMIKMVRDMGFPISVMSEPGMIRIRFPTSIDPVTIKEFEEN